MIPDDEAGSDAEGRRVAHLLRDPGRGGLAGHGHVHDPTRAKIDDEEREDGPGRDRAQIAVDGNSATMIRDVAAHTQTSMTDR